MATTAARPVTSPLAQARSGVRTANQARKLRDRLEAELSLSDDLAPDWEKEAEQAITVLNERFGKTIEMDPETQSDAPKLSAGARKGERKSSGPDVDRRTGEPVKPASSSRPAVTAPRRSAGRGRRSGGRRGPARRTVRRATPQVVTDWGRFAVQSLGTMVALSLAYLLLRDAERKGNKSAVSVAAGGFAQAVTRLLDPHTDVFGHSAQLAAPAAPASTYNDLVGAGLVDGPPAPARTSSPPGRSPARRRGGLPNVPYDFNVAAGLVDGPPAPPPKSVVVHIP